MKKKDLTLSLISGRPGLLACPFCRGALSADASYALRCPSGHSFDISSSGYINLLTKAAHSDYGAAMLEARRCVCAAGFFDAMLDEVVSLVRGRAGGSPVLLDAGSGEGSHLEYVCRALGVAVTGVGVDISRDGVHIAAREHTGFLWLVADLARLPLADNSVDILLNILSPSNYAEFSRVLKDDGLFVKAVPGECYLVELRSALYSGEGREEYSNEKVVSLFEQSFALEEKLQIRRSFSVKPALWPDIVAMTPLAWGKDEAVVRTVIESPQECITLDFLLLVGQKKGKGKDAHERSAGEI